ncbi:MAG: hypothetical protein QG614_199 [Patescibacteria group bacterium]|nr:hypothetical protein [Patescibacteria group bacterium]
MKISESKLFLLAKTLFILLAVFLIIVDILYFDKVPFYTIIIIIILVTYNVLVKNIR